MTTELLTDELRAELIATIDERDQLRAEVKRLRAVLDTIKEIAWKARALEESSKLS